MQEDQAFCRRQYHEVITKNRSRYGVKLARVYGAGGGGVELPKPFGNQRILSESQMSDTEICTVGLLFCFDLILTVLWLFPLGIRKYFTYFDFIGTHSYETFEKLSNFKVTLYILNRLNF